MNKLVNFFLLITVILFFLSITNYYLSNNNIKNVNIKRSNIDEIKKNQRINLPVLKNDTNNIIEFNSSFSEEISNNEKRSFWNLLKSK